MEWRAMRKSVEAEIQLTMTLPECRPIHRRIPVLPKKSSTVLNNAVSQIHVYELFNTFSRHGRQLHLLDRIKTCIV